MPKKKSEKKAKKSTKNIKAKGLGDTVEQVLEATGIAKIAKWALGEDCGCDERKAKLNYLFPYYKPECLTEDEFNILDKYYTEGKSTVTSETQQELLVIYNRVFHQQMNLTSCSSCFKNNLHKKLERVYIEYKK